MSSDESRLERWLDREIARAESPRGAAVIIASVSTVMTVGAGMLMTVVDHKNFPTIGQGLWWAVQTVTTVGYGDHVPANVSGRLVAAVVMLIGIGFLTVITAAITSSFVTRSQEERHKRSGGSGGATEAHVQELNERLDRIEKALDARP